MYDSGVHISSRQICTQKWFVVVNKTPSPDAWPKERDTCTGDDGFPGKLSFRWLQFIPFPCFRSVSTRRIMEHFWHIYSSPKTLLVWEIGILGVAVSMLGWVPGYSWPHPVPRPFPLHRLSHWHYLLISCSSGSTHTDRPLHGSLFNCLDHMDFLPPLDCIESFVIRLCNILPCERVACFCVIVLVREFSFSRWPSPTGQQRLPNYVPWAESSPRPICL